MDENAIADLHLALANGVLLSIEEKKRARRFGIILLKFFDDVVVAILEEENKRNNRKDRKRFANVWPFDMGATFHMTTKREWFHQYKPNSGGRFVYSCNDHELKIIAIGSIMEMLGVPIKKKSNVFEVFNVYKARVELDSGKKFKCLRTVNGGEYTGDKFDIFCRQEGIKREFTTTYTPQQNGVVERRNKNLLERARAMLETASLGKLFWAKAVNTTCYVINRSPSTAVELKTPIEIWTEKPINYSYLHIFGSPVYVMYNTLEITKLDPKSRKCLFLGYADGVKGYRLWDLAAHKVVISRDVVFMEDKIQENKEEQLDVKTAFLHGNLEEEIYMLQPKGFEQKGKENLVCKLNKSMCGLKQAPRCWYKRFDSFIRSLEYNRLHADPCAYFKRFRNNDFIILRLYVDDMLVAGPNIDRINKLKAQLSREFKMEDLGPTNKILRMQIHRDRLSSKMSPSSEKEMMEMSRVLYASAVGSVIFAMICTRPEIAHAVGVVSRYMAEPDLIVKRYVDSDYAGDLDGSKSTIGYVFTLFGRTISWVLKLQSIMSMSTMEAEYVAAAQASKEAVRLKMLLEELSHE
nr:Gag-Pol polyprotein [Tanacetum cinerariifolium]